MVTELIYEDLTEKVIGCAFEVHKFLGCGFQELVYQRALAIEFEAAGLEFAREVEMPIYYKDVKPAIGIRRADFIVQNKVLVEIKAHKDLEDVHLAQTLNYLKVYRLHVGILINFGSRQMTFKRLVN